MRQDTTRLQVSEIITEAETTRETLQTRRTRKRDTTRPKNRESRDHEKGHVYASIGRKHNYITSMRDTLLLLLLLMTVTCMKVTAKGETTPTKIIGVTDTTASDKRQYTHPQPQEGWTKHTLILIQLMCSK